MSQQHLTGGALRALGVVLGLAVAHTAATLAFFDSAEQLRVVHDLAGWAGACVGVLGTVAALRSFSPGDYLRRVWAGFAAGAALLLVSTAMRSYWTHFEPGRAFADSALLPARTLVVVAANVTTTWALVMLALAYRRAGLRPASTRRSRVLLALGGAAALAIALLSVQSFLRPSAPGAGAAWSATMSIASTLGDFATILLAMPLLRVASMLRGGRLAWVWWVMGASGAVWLVYDASEWLVPLLPGEAARAGELFNTLRSLGMSLVGVAGWLQREALEAQPRAAPQPSLDVAGVA
ncbi:MAG: hypothetical protein L0Y66_09940 [Myxococcaceae bacterium]|nr:hypothetical protein [Myxococcaceae bacterium]MCI0670605.1 hypothetical protein [Myxococcaceae bacterium]